MELRDAHTLERPAEFKDKPFLTAAEAAAFEQKTLKAQDRDRRDVDRATGRGSAGRTDVDRANNQAWWEFGSKVVGTPRTSLVIDPPDGMIPALTPDGARRALDKRGLWMPNGNCEGAAIGTGLDLGGSTAGSPSPAWTETLRPRVFRDHPPMAREAGWRLRRRMSSGYVDASRAYWTNVAKSGGSPCIDRPCEGRKGRPGVTGRGTERRIRALTSTRSPLMFPIRHSKH